MRHKICEPDLSMDKYWTLANFYWDPENTIRALIFNDEKIGNSCMFSERYFSVVCYGVSWVSIFVLVMFPDKLKPKMYLPMFLRMINQIRLKLTGLKQISMWNKTSIFRKLFHLQIGRQIVFPLEKRSVNLVNYFRVFCFWIGNKIFFIAVN